MGYMNFLYEAFALGFMGWENKIHSFHDWGRAYLV